MGIKLLMFGIKWFWRCYKASVDFCI